MVCLRHCPLIIDHAALLPGRSHRVYEGVPTCKTQLKLNYMYYRAVRVVCLRHISSISSMIDHDLAALLSSCCHTCRAPPRTRATYKAATGLYPYTCMQTSIKERVIGCHPYHSSDKLLQILAQQYNDLLHPGI